MTTGELAARIKKLAIALDPEWAARRYAAAVRDRDVIGYLDEDGTATVTGRQLPADQAAAACARIEDLAKAAKWAGYPGRIGPLQADIYLGLLDGRWTHYSGEEIITDLLAQATPTNQPIPDQCTPDDAPQRPTQDDSVVTDGAPVDGAPVTNDDQGADDAPVADRDPEAEGAAGGDAGSTADDAAETDTPTGDTPTTGKAGRVPGPVPSEAGWGWSCEWGCPLCSDTTATPETFLDGALSPQRLPVPWRLPSTAPSGATRSLIRRGGWSWAGSPAAARAHPRATGEAVAPVSGFHPRARSGSRSGVGSWNCISRPPCSPNWPRTLRRAGPGPR